MKKRLAIVVSHPVQYFAPLYQRLARREDVTVKVFYTWHAGQAPVKDRGFNKLVAWDIPLTSGYEFELVPNVSSDPGDHHFWGLNNPSLVGRIMAWGPDAVHVTGWAWYSHLQALWALSRRGVATFFRGDSHLLDGGLWGPRWWAKRAVLTRVYSWPAAFLCVGKANRAYYEAFGVEADRLHDCPHSIDVERFAEPAESLEVEAASWRRELDIGDDRVVLLFAGKFERKKQPLELMRAVRELGGADIVLIMVGGGELDDEVRAIAASDPSRFRVLPFQNQSRMPVVYRLGDVFVLPSAYEETWGLAVNEAMACGRPAIVSDRVGCAEDMIDESCGRVFPRDDFPAMMRVVAELAADRKKRSDMGLAASRKSGTFSTAQAAYRLMECLLEVRHP